MANYETLAAQVAAVVKTNGSQAITGANLQAQLLAMIASLGANYQYAGVAIPSTIPGTPDQKVFYIAATAGTYTNFGGIVLADGEVAVIKGSGSSWTKEVTGVATAAEVSQLGQKVDDLDAQFDGMVRPTITVPSGEEETIITSADVSQGDMIIIKANSNAEGASRSVYQVVNGNRTTLFSVSSTTPISTRYYVPKNFESIIAGQYVTISVFRTTGIGYSNLISNLKQWYTNDILFNKFIKEFFVIGADLTKTYEIDAIRARTSDNIWSISLYEKESGNLRAKFEDTIKVIAGNTYNHEKTYLIYGKQQSSSGISFYAIVDWNVLTVNTVYNIWDGYRVTLLEDAFSYKSNPTITNYLKEQERFVPIDFNTFNYKIGSFDWSGFISLDNVDRIVFKLHKIYGEISLYFYENEMSFYESNYLQADYIMAYTRTTQDNIVMGEVLAPKKYKYFSFRVSDKTDFVYLLKNARGFNVDVNRRFIESAKCISDGFVPSSGEPNLLYDKETGIVYENYICGTIYGHDPEGNLGFAQIPLVQPERARYSIPVTFNVTEIDGDVVSFRDIMCYFYSSSVIRNVTFGKRGDGTRKLVFLDQNLDGTLVGNFQTIKWGDNTEVTYDSYLEKVTDAGCTVIGQSEEHLLFPSSSHVQEYNGAKYFTLCAEKECPMICRTTDDFNTIEVVKVFQIACRYEMALVINDTDWYVVIRTQDGLYYTYSTDGGTTWSQEETIINGNSSKPRGLVYDGEIVFLIPTICVENLGRSIVSDEDGVLTNSRYSIKFVRGDKNTASINDWKCELELASKYGQNYGDIISVGKDIYYCWSADYTHLHSIPTASKSQIMFTRIGNFDNIDFFGDV